MLYRCLSLLLLAAVLCCFTPQAAFCQNELSGKWSGEIYQDPGGLRVAYDYEIDILIQGNKITGTSRIQFKDRPENYIIHELKGVYDGEVLYLNDVRSIEESLDYGYWCTKMSSLRVVVMHDELWLTGPWAAGACAPGTLTVKRKLIRA